MLHRYKGYITLLTDHRPNRFKKHFMWDNNIIIAIELLKTENNTRVCHEKL